MPGWDAVDGLAAQPHLYRRKLCSHWLVLLDNTVRRLIPVECRQTASKLVIETIAACTA